MAGQPAAAPQHTPLHQDATAEHRQQRTAQEGDGDVGRLDGKVAIITGAARGQGAAEARRFVAEGAVVVIADVLVERGAAVAAELGDRALFVEADVAEEAAWERVIGAAVGRFGRLDILVNNAAILHTATIEATTRADLERVIAVNLVGTFLGVRAVAPHLREQGSGSIVNVSSIDGVVAMNGLGAYAATKFAVRGITKVAALELGPYGVRVNALVPGTIATEMQGDVDLTAPAASGYFAHQALPRPGRVEEVAAAAVFLASDDSAFCTGGELFVDGGHCAGTRTRWLPGGVVGS